MKQRLFWYGGLLLLLVGMGGCGGGGGGDNGGGGGGGAGLPLATGTFVKTFGPAATNGNVMPFGADGFGDVKHQMLYTAAEIGGAGRITALRFKYSASVAASVTCPNTTIRLGHTRLTALTTTFGANVNQGSGSQRTVLDNTTVSIPAGAAGAWFEIPLATPFEYNGIDNLVVEVERTTTCSGEVPVASVDASGNRRAFSSATDSAPGAAEHNPTTADGVDTTHLLQQFVFSGGDDKIDLGGAGNNFWPFTQLNGNEKLRIQNLYLASEINGSGPITGVAFQINTATVAGSYTYTLKLGHSTLTALAATFASNYAGAPTTVANAVSFTIPAGVPAGEWVWVPVPDGVFTYNGTDNLIVEVATSSGTADTFLRSATIAGRRVNAFYTTGTATTGSVDSTAYHIALRFNGGTMDVNTPFGVSGGGADLFLFHNLDGKRQWLYLATELGSKGAITKIACRSRRDSTAESDLNYTVVLSHTTAATLGADFAANLAAPVTVFSSTFSIPAALTGDWLEIPLATPFAYNGKDNLVVQIEGTGGADENAQCVMDFATRYAARSVENESSGTSSGTVTDGLLDMRFTLQ